MIQINHDWWFNQVICTRCILSDCGKVDLVFVVDASGSIRNSNPRDNSYDNWNLMLQFINDVIYRFNVGSAGLRVGLVTFGNLAHNEFFLSQYTNYDQLSVAVMQSTYLDQNTNTSAGIRLHFHKYIIQTCKISSYCNHLPTLWS